MRTTNQLAAEKILVAHQRKDIGSCLCGWGVDDGHLGHSHAGHIIDVLTAAKLISEPAAVDRESLAEWLYTELEWPGDPENHWDSLRSQDLYRWRTIAGQLLEHWGILDAAAVRRDFAAWCLESHNAVGRLKDTVAGFTPPAPPTEG